MLAPQKARLLFQDDPRALGKTLGLARRPGNGMCKSRLLSQQLFRTKRLHDIMG